jgi:hypothetical protein
MQMLIVRIEPYDRPDHEKHVRVTNVSISKLWQSALLARVLDQQNARAPTKRT